VLPPNLAAGAAALRALDRLYVATGRWRELAEILPREADIGQTPEEILDFKHRLGQVREVHLDDVQGAIGAYREILAAAPEYAPTLEALERLVDSARSATDVVDDARRAVGLGWVDIVVEGIVFIVVASLVYLVIERILIAYRAHSSAIDACEQQLRATGVPCTGDQLLSYERIAAEREGQYGVLPAVGAAVSNVGEAAAGATRMVPLVLGVVGIAALIAYSRPGTAGYAAYESASAAASRAASSASAAASRAASRARAAASSARARFSRA
jgi:hypothetical protein